MNRPSLAGAAVVVLAVAVLLGCGSGDESASPAPAAGTTAEAPPAPSLPTLEPPGSQPDLLPIVAPDLSRLSSAARRQIEEEHGRLGSRIAGATGPMLLGDAYGQTGMLYLAADFPATAEVCFRNARMLQPEEFRWPYYLGHLYRGEGRAEDAVSAFRAALELRPEALAALVWLGRTHLEQGAVAEAGPPLERAVQIDPGSGSALFAMGQAALARQEYEPAVQYLEKALEQAPGGTSIHYQLAMAYRGLGRMELAEEHLRQRGDVDVQPYDPLMEELRAMLVNPMMHMDRGGRAYAEGLFEEAVKEFRKGVASAEEDPLMHLNLGAALFRAGATGEAASAFGEALRIDPQLAAAHYGLGALAENAGRDDEARERYTAALAADPDHAMTLRRLGDVARRTGRDEEAVEHYRGAIRVNPRDAEARLGQMMALVRLGRWAEAVQRTEESVSALPEQPAFAHALARLLVSCPDDALRDAPRAMQILQQLGASGPPSTALGESIAMAFAETGQFEQAARFQEAVIQASKEAAQLELARMMERNLAGYRSGRPCREPWREQDPLFEVPRNAEPPAPQRRPDLG